MTSAHGPLPLRSPRRSREALRWPLLLWAVVLLVTMLSFYVHLLNEQIQRGERLRASQRTPVLQQAAPAGNTAIADPSATVRVAAR